MKKIIVQFYQRYRELILYLFFGVCTTLVNTVAYGLFYEVLSWSNVLSAIFAWLFAVIFAFITNKVCVFQSKPAKTTDTIKEITSFFMCRLLTGILDVVIMVIAVDCLNGNSLIWKLVSNIVVTIINYIASYLFIFKKTR